jgi:tetratricopeptide (TPR) repeat protein
VSGSNAHAVEARGYPRASKQAEGPRDLTPALGRLTAADRDRPLRFGVYSSDLPNNPHAGWPGMSGSAVLLQDGPDQDEIWIYGVVQAVPVNFDRQLNVARLADVWQDAIFRRLLVAAGAPDKDAEDPTVGARTVSQQLAELKALFQREIAATTAEYRVPREVVDRLLVTVGLAGTEPAAIPSAFEELVRRFAAMRDALQQQRNDDPEIATLKQQASDALAAADLNTAERLLSAIRARQRTLSDRRRGAADDAQTALVAALEDEAATCVRQADAALLRLGVAEALGFYQDGIAVLADAPAATRWRYALAAAGALQEFGDRAGRNDALLGCLGLYELALRDADRDRVPLDWARTQTNLGAALQMLGARESGTARLEEAVGAYRAALEERTRDRVPLDWAMTQNNLGAALQTLGDRESGTARLEEAVAAYRAALEEFTRDRVPLDWR